MKAYEEIEIKTCAMLVELVELTTAQIAHALQCDARTVQDALMFSERLNYQWDAAGHKRVWFFDNMEN